MANLDVAEIKKQVFEFSENIYNKVLEIPLPTRIAIGVGVTTIYPLTKYLVWRFREKSKRFNAYTLNTEAINGLNLKGQTVIVTGANNGIGLETVRVLANQGAKIIMACRNLKKGEEAKNDILQSLNNDNVDLELMELDLSNLESVRQFADTFNSKGLKINYLINNAGIMALPEYKQSTDGFEMQFATNHLGHFYLTTLLMPSLLKRVENETSGGNDSNERQRLPRVINLSSTAHRRPTNYEMTRRMFLDATAKKQFMVTPAEYDAWENYGISKTSNILFARELQKRYGNELISVSVHPGGVNSTNLSSTVGFWDSLKFVKLLLFNPSIYYKNMKSKEQGAATTLRCVSMDDDEIAKGHYYANCNDENDNLMSVARESLNDNGALAALLWDLSQALIESRGFSINCSHCNINNRHEMHK